MGANAGVLSCYSGGLHAPHAPNSEALLDYGLDTFELDTEIYPRCFLRMVQLLGLQDGLSLCCSTVVAFAEKVVYSYRDVPYHSSRHGFGVSQFLFASLNNSAALCRTFSKLDMLAAIVAALVHDVDHPGNNNAWEVANKSALAVRYKDTAVLENHHAAVGLQILAAAECDMFGKLPAHDRNEVVETYTHAILMTDMAQHFKMVGDMEERMTRAEPFAPELLSERRSCAGVLLHAADISNPVLPNFELARNWAERITQEFRNQYRNEQDAGLPVTKMWAGLDEPLAFYKSQVGFIGFIVAPLWNIAFNIFEWDDLRASLERNKARWSTLAEEEEAIAMKIPLRGDEHFEKLTP